MRTVRLLVGTPKGAFVLTADGQRRQSKVEGPHFGGWEEYHVKASPADPNRLYAPLPEMVASGEEPLLIVGAFAGG